MYESTDGSGTNEALNCAAVASSEYSATYAAGKAFDGDAGATRWAAQNTPAAYQWIYVDLGDGKEVKSIKIKPRASGAYCLIGQTCAIEYSANAIDWTTLMSISPANSETLQTFQVQESSFGTKRKNQLLPLSGILTPLGR